MQAEVADGDVRWISDTVAWLAREIGDDFELSAAEKTRRAARFVAMEALDELARVDPAAAGEIACRALDYAYAGSPAVSLDDLRADAEFWADCAHPREVEVYFAACLSRLGKTDLGLNARKRLFAALWESFDPAERRAVVRRVDPEGKIRRGR